MDEQREAVRKMQDYIREHIQEDITIEDLANASAFSPWYARRLFQKYLNMTPAVYIRRLKLSKSALKLRDEQVTVLDVALDMGFGSVDGYFSYCEEVGCDVWGLLSSIKSISGEPVCMWLPEKLRKPVTNEYVQGVEVENDYTESIPEGFEIIELPAAKYLLFRGEPFAEEDYAQAITEIWQAEKKYDPAFIVYEWDKDNPRIQLEPRGERGYIELVPVKEKR